jgi:hypothetical protein
MPIQTIVIERVADDKIVDAFSEIKQKFQSSSLAFRTLTIQHALKSDDSKQMQLLKQLMKIDLGTVIRADFDVSSLRICYRRGAEGLQTKEVDPSRTLFDTIEIETRQDQQRQFDELEAAKAIAAFRAHFVEVDLTKAAPSGSAAQARIEALHNSMLERLEVIAAKQIANLNDFQLQKLSEHDARRKEIDAELLVRKAAQDAANEKELERIRDREQKLQNRQKQLDDRDNTHVRREIRVQLNDVINTRLNRITFNTRSLFREIPIHFGFIGIVCVSAYLAIIFAGNLAEFLSTSTDKVTGRPLNEFRSVSDPALIWLALKQTIATATAIGAAVYYVRWLIRQHHDYTQAEGNLRRYQIDFERASWVVETALEWKRDQSQQIPEHLLGAISRQLFVWESREAEADQSPADMLASALLGKASKINLNTGPAQFEWNGKNLQKAEMPNPVHAR